MADELNKFKAVSSTGGDREIQAAKKGGVGSENQIPSLDSNGRLHETMLPTGVAPETANIVAKEALSAGDFVNIFADSGAFKVRKADAVGPGKEAMGFVKEAVADGATALVYREGNNDAVDSVSPGKLFLSIIAGRFTSIPPKASGNVTQQIGFGTSETNINVNILGGVERV